MHNPEAWILPNRIGKLSVSRPIGGEKRGMGILDGLTLLLLLVVGLCLGLLGFFDFDALAWAVGEHNRILVYQATGVSAVWQCFRQHRWWRLNDE
jgi:uncharacterized membrane protein YuzA (DUF378 family)